MNKGKVKVILILTFIIGLFILLYPSVSQYINSFNQSTAITDYDKMFLNNKDVDYTEDFNKAYAYNAELAKLRYPLAQYEKLSDYDE